MTCNIGPEPMDICTSSTSLPCEIPSCNVTVLEGHTSEVWMCIYIMRLCFLYLSEFLLAYICFSIPNRFLHVHGVQQVCFLPQGEYIVLWKRCLFPIEKKTLQSLSSFESIQFRTICVLFLLLLWTASRC